MFRCVSHSFADGARYCGVEHPTVNKASAHAHALNGSSGAPWSVEAGSDGVNWFPSLPFDVDDEEPPGRHPDRPALPAPPAEEPEPLGDDEIEAMARAGFPV